MPWFDALAHLPAERNDEATGEWAEELEAIASTNRQHPDRDTGSSPPARPDG